MKNFITLLAIEKVIRTVLRREISRQGKRERERVGRGGGGGGKALEVALLKRGFGGITREKFAILVPLYVFLKHSMDVSLMFLFFRDFFFQDFFFLYYFFFCLKKRGNLSVLRNVSDIFLLWIHQVQTIK